MNLNEFQQAALSSAIYPKKHGLVYTTLGLAGEAGEIANKVKKILRDDAGTLTDDKRIALAAELGDVLWYVAAVARELDCTLESIGNGVLLKLAERKERGTLGGSGDQR